MSFARNAQLIPNEAEFLDGEEVVHLKIAKKTIICLFSTEAKRAAVIAFPEQSAISKKDLESTIQELAKRSEQRPLQAKIIGETKALLEVRNSLRDLEVSVVGELKDPGTQSEAFFYPDSGRLRVQKISTQAAPLKVLNQKRRVLIVDDSKTIQDLFKHIFARDSRLEVVGVTGDPREVSDMIRRLKPDVITLDMHMPHMDGLECLQKQIMTTASIPTVIITSMRMEDSPQVLKALELGAVDYIQKPSFDDMDHVSTIIIEKVFEASRARVQEKIQRIKEIDIDVSKPMGLKQNIIVAIGSSTGGTEALRSLFERMPADIPPILVVQHIPATFSAALAQRLNDVCAFEVKEAADGDLIKSGRVLIAPGGQQMKVKRNGDDWIVRLTDDPPVNRFKPSVDYLFSSVAKEIGRKSVGIVLTGMGSDGAKGLKEMKDQGSKTFGQDEASSVVYGMPKAAFEMGGVDQVVSLDDMPSQLCKYLLK